MKVFQPMYLIEINDITIMRNQGNSLEDFYFSYWHSYKKYEKPLHIVSAYLKNTDGIDSDVVEKRVELSGGTVIIERLHLDLKNCYLMEIKYS